MEEAQKELNAKAYAMTLKEEETLNQWLDEQLKVLWNTLDLTFYFSFIYFSFDFIFLFSFLFSFRTMKKAHDKEVT